MRESHSGLCGSAEWDLCVENLRLDRSLATETEWIAVGTRRRSD